MRIQTGINFEKYSIHNADYMKQSQNISKSHTADDLIETAISVKLSEKGKQLAGELKSFDDTYDVTRTLLSGIGVSETVDGSFVDILAYNYKEQANSLKAQYTDEAEYNNQIKLLDKAFSDASLSVSAGYTKQMRILTGDIVFNTKLTNYATEAETEKASDESEGKEKATVIDRDLSDKIVSDVNNICFAARNSLLKDGTISLNSKAGDTFSYLDLKKIGSYLLDKKHQSDIDGISDFAQHILADARNMRTENSMW